MAFYSVGILICLCPYFIHPGAIASSDIRSGYKGRYGREPAHYEVVFPTKVKATGEFMSHTIPQYYKKSSYKGRKRPDMDPEDMVHYALPIAGERHHLELYPNHGIASPGMVVEVHDDKGWSQRTIRKSGNLMCHYTGSVRGHEGSRVALSTCHGLSGYVRTKRGYFIIEPAAGHNPLSGDEHPHLLYQREEDPPPRETNCETVGNLAQVLARRASSSKRVEKKFISSPTSELHIETMVVLDKTFLKYHKALDVENYVLTVFNMAHDLYHDESLKKNINLAIVRMIRLEQEEHQLNLAVNKDVKKTLNYFVDWQRRMDPGNDSHPNHHDVAVLLTRLDLCGENSNNCGLLGASIMGGICNPFEQAAICQDNGLRVGFTIAHEIAHTLAIPHDSLTESGCDPYVPAEGGGDLSTVMSPAISIQTAEWSPCSAHYLDLALNQGLGKCLLDPPTDHSFETPDILPGVMYGGDFQCRELFGPSAGLCDTGIECDNLICFVEDRGCIESHQSPAPGTNCGEKKWCYRGKCVEVGQRPGAVNGGWSEWSKWSGCSRTCGSGVAIRIRHCSSPAPAHGGKYCIGEHKSHRLCNTEPCEPGQPSFRTLQCAEFDDWIYPEDRKLHSWKAYHMADENPCVLYCVNDEGEVASLRPRVVDGTKCVRGMRDICIDGICKEVPCDLDLQSKAVEDWCGICRGDGTACTIIEGQQFIKEPPEDNEGKKRIKLIDIPEGSMNIKVEEDEPSASTIEVYSEDGKTVYVEGGLPGIYNISGAKGWLGNIRTMQEALTIPGSISKSLSIWIATAGNVTIKYSYGEKATNKRHTHFDWDFLEWSKCSANCGPGMQEVVPQCVEKVAGLVDDMYCNNTPKPKEQIRPCELAPCLPRWMIGNWQECICSQSKHFRMVKCVKPTGEGEGESIVVSDSECAPPKPVQKQPCHCKVKAIKRGVVKGKSKSKSKAKGEDREVEATTNFWKKKTSGFKRQLTEETTCIPFEPDVAEFYETTTKEYHEPPALPKNLTGLHGMVIDKQPLDEVKLTIHGGPSQDDNPNSLEEVEGQHALRLQNNLQLQFRVNNTQI